jgi:hypothetical protein
MAESMLFAGSELNEERHTPPSASAPSLAVTFFFGGMLVFCFVCVSNWEDWIGSWWSG